MAFTYLVNASWINAVLETVATFSFSTLIIIGGLIVRRNTDRLAEGLGRVVGRIVS